MNRTLSGSKLSNRTFFNATIFLVSSSLALNTLLYVPCPICQHQPPPPLNHLIIIITATTNLVSWQPPPSPITSFTESASPPWTFFVRSKPLGTQSRRMRILCVLDFDGGRALCQRLSYLVGVVCLHGNRLVAPPEAFYREVLSAMRLRIVPRIQRRFLFVDGLSMVCNLCFLF